MYWLFPNLKVWEHPLPLHPVPAPLFPIPSAGTHLNFPAERVQRER